VVFSIGIPQGLPHEGGRLPGVISKDNVCQKVTSKALARKSACKFVFSEPRESGRLGPPPLFELRRVGEPSKVAP
jgi:hypothetical protein